MSWKSEKVSMPVSSAGILSVSPDMEISGVKVDPRTIVIGIIVFILVVTLAHILVK